jgi:hypothetical protein
MLLLFKVDGGLQLWVSLLFLVVVLPLLLVVGVLHVGFLRLLVLVLGRLLVHLLVNLIGRLVALLFVL